MLKQKKYSLVLLLLIIGLAFGAQTADASLSAKKVNIGQNFEYAINIIGEADKYIPPEFMDCLIVSGPNNSFTYQLKDGVKIQKLRIYWTLAAKRAGKIHFSKATVVFKELRVQTNDLILKVRNRSDQNIQLN